MTERNIEYLLKKYETKQPGEIWETKTEVQAVQDYRLKQKIFIFDGINTQYFRFGEEKKARAEYLIEHLDFNKFPRWKEEEIIAAICWYVNVEHAKEYRLRDHLQLFKEYNLNERKLLQLVINVNRLILRTKPVV